MADGGEECGYDTEFVKAPDFQSECSICLLILREPHQVKCCGERFCKKCVKKLENNRQCCPKCRKRLLYFHDKKCQQELNKVQVRCSNRKHGCSWTGGLCDLNKHLNSKPTPTQVYLGCEVVSLKCTYCRRNFKRVELKEHTEKRCDCRPYSCEYCEQYRSTYKKVQSHYSVCLYFTITCSKCTAKLPRKDQQDHLDNTCPLVEVECEYNYAGCDARVLRKDLSAHMRDVDHNTLLIKHLEKKIASLESESRQSQERMEVERDRLSTELRQEKIALEVLSNKLTYTATGRNSAERKCKTLEDSLKKTEADRDSAKQRCQSLYSMLKDAEADRDSGKERLAGLSILFLDLQRQRETLEDSLQKAEAQRDSAKQRCEWLSSVLKDTKAERDDAKEQCDELSNAVCNGEVTNHSLSESLSEAQTDRDTAKNKCETLSESLSETERRLGYTQYSLNSTESDLNDVRKQRDRLNTIKNNNEQSYKKQVKELEESNSLLTGFIGGAVLLIMLLFCVCFMFASELRRFLVQKFCL